MIKVLWAKIINYIESQPNLNHDFTWTDDDPYCLYWDKGSLHLEIGSRKNTNYYLVLRRCFDDTSATCDGFEVSLNDINTLEIDKFLKHVEAFNLRF